MQDDNGALTPFRNFAGTNGDYYAGVFLTQVSGFKTAKS